MMNRVNRRTVFSSEKMNSDEGPGGDPGPPPTLDPCAPEEFPPFLEPMIARPKGREMNCVHNQWSKIIRTNYRNI